MPLILASGDRSNFLLTIRAGVVLTCGKDNLLKLVDPRTFQVRHALLILKLILVSVLRCVVVYQMVQEGGGSAYAHSQPDLRCSQAQASLSQAHSNYVTVGNWQRCCGILSMGAVLQAPQVYRNADP